MRSLGLLLSLFFCAVTVFSQPLAPSLPVSAPGPLFSQGMQAAVLSLTVDPSTRPASRQFYRSVYFPSEGVPLQWTGSYTTGDAGTTSSAFKDAVALRLNWFRAMAGIPAAITLDATYSSKAQQAALMMSVNNQLSHTPPSSWTFYTAAGAEAASNSNLTLGYYGPDSVTALMRDDGSNNAAVGHRRWFLYPQTRVMGTGDVPGNASFSPAQAVWVFDNFYGTARPSVRDAFVAWPPKGYVPYNLIFARWSFSYPDADFSSATLTVTKNGSPVAVVKEPLAPGYGENTLVWFVDGVLSGSLNRPSADVPYVVTLTNVIVGGSARNFSYTVTAYDPDVQGAGETLVAVAGPTSIGSSQAASFTLSGPPYADGFQWRILSTVAQSTVLGAEGGLQGLVPVISDTYSARVTSSQRTGTGAYYLAMPTGAAQYLTLPDSYFVPSTGSPAFSFYSRLGYATTQQIARLQVSLDEGTSWTDLWTQTGTSGAGELSYNLRSVSLAAFAGRTLRFRFCYTVEANGSYYFQTTTNVGWLIDDITLPSLQLATALSAPQSASGSSFTLTQSTVGEFLLQGRGLFGGIYPMEWGVARSLSVAALITSASSTSFVVGTPGSFTVTAPASPAVTFSATGLPSWATLNASTGVLSGTAPNATGSPFTITLTANNGAGFLATQTFTLSVSEILPVSHLVNVSVRANSRGSANPLIVGFSVSGGPRTLLIRSIGPTLKGFGVTTAVDDPLLNLFQTVNGQPTVIATNDQWSASNVTALQAAFATTYAFSLAVGSLDSALLASVEGSRSAQSYDPAKSGVVLIEVYDTLTKEAGHLVNVSARNYAGTGDDVLTAGFSIQGDAPVTLLIRAVGSELEGFGVKDVIKNPLLELFRTVGTTSTQIGSNDDWDSSDLAAKQAAFTKTYAFALTTGSKSSCLIVTLQPGLYSAQLKGVGGATGEGLLEVYVVP